MMFLNYLFTLLLLSNTNTMMCSSSSSSSSSSSFSSSSSSSSLIGRLTHPFQKQVFLNDLEGVIKSLPSYSNLEMPNSFGQTVLHIAVIKNYNEMTKLLLLSGSNPNTQDHNGRTALHLACISLNLDIISLLSSRKASSSIKDIYQNTPYHYCQTLSPERQAFNAKYFRNDRSNFKIIFVGECAAMVARNSVERAAEVDTSFGNDLLPRHCTKRLLQATENYEDDTSVIRISEDATEGHDTSVIRRSEDATEGHDTSVIRRRYPAKLQRKFEMGKLNFSF